MIDTHSHIQFKIFDKDLDEVIQRAVDAGVEKIIAVGTDIESSKKAVAIAKQSPNVYAAVGMHPHHVYKMLLKCHPEERPTYEVHKGGSDVRILQKEEPLVGKIATSDALLAMTNELEQIITDSRVVAVGETGLDTHLYPQTKYQNYQMTKEFLMLQEKVFIEQIKLALKYQKTLIIHNRGAVEKLLEILEKYCDPFFEQGAVFHCCEPDQKLLDFAKKHQVFIGVDGDVTYDKVKQEFIKKVPLELLVLETDSPFFVPEPLKIQGSQRNEPANLVIIADFLEKLTHKNVREMSRINSAVLFKFPS